MISRLHLSAVADNVVRQPDLLAEWGLAFWIEADGQRLLFDTGAGRVLEHNARRLNVPLETADTIILSHGHYDHTSGLVTLLSGARRSEVWIHPAAFAPKFSRTEGAPARSIGMPHLNQQDVRMRARALNLTEGPAKVAEGVWITGEIPRRNDFEDTGGPFYLDPDCRQPDPLLDDQALWVETARGLVVVLGCAHAGVINTLEYISQLTGRPRIRAVVGGFHLVRASEQRLERTIRALEKYDPQLIAPAHCTGWKGTLALATHFPGRVAECAAGASFRFNA